MRLTFRNDVDAAVSVMREAGSWLVESGRDVSPAWEPSYLVPENLLRVGAPNEFFVGLVDEKPAVAALLQEHQSLQDWSLVDRGDAPSHLYVHWLAVAREFAGTGLPQAMIEFASDLARDRGLRLLRLDTHADNENLMRIYADLGFELVAVIEELGGNTALFQRRS